MFLFLRMDRNLVTPYLSKFSYDGATCKFIEAHGTLLWTCAHDNTTESRQTFPRLIFGDQKFRIREE